MSRIPEQTIRQVLDATDIVDLIGRSVELKRVGSNFRGLCPFHQEKTPSFYVTPGRGFKCFGCGASGTAVGWLIDHDGLSFPDAIRRLAQSAGIRIVEEAPDPKAAARAASRDRLLSLHAAAANFYHQLLLRSQAAAHARSYLEGRQISLDTASSWQLGYAPESADELLSAMAAAGFHRDVLVEGGLLALRDEAQPSRGTYARFRDRIMFPVCDDDGRVVAFSGRLLDPDAKAAKYLNSPETPIFSKSRVLFGFHRSRRPILRASQAVVVEGQIDLITCFEAGITNLVAPLGTAFTELHARTLKRHAQEVILCYDSDAAGHKAASRSFQILAPAGLLVRVAPVPQGLDPDALVRQQGADALRQILAEASDFFTFSLHASLASAAPDDLRARIALTTEMLEHATLLPDKMAQDDAIQRIAVAMGTPEPELRALIRQRKRAALPPAQARQTPGGPAAAAPAKPPIRIHDPHIALLCKLCLTSAELRCWLLEQDLDPICSHLPGGRVLHGLLHANFDPDSLSSVGRFLESLPSHVEAGLSHLLFHPLPGEDKEGAIEALHALHQQDRARQIKVLKDQLTTATDQEQKSLLFAEIVRLQSTPTP
jgi:DNA primase